MKHRFSGLLFWHKILLLLSVTILVLTLGIAFAIRNTLDEAQREMGRESRAILSRQTENFIEKNVRGQAATLDVQLNRAKAAARYGAMYLEKYLKHCEPGRTFPEKLLPALFADMNFCSMSWFAPLAGNIRIWPAANLPEDLPDAHTFLSSPFFPKNRLDPASVPNPMLGEVTNVEAVWSEVHVNPLSLSYDLVIDAVAPVFSNGGIHGYMGISISLVSLITQFNHFQAIRSSYTFLMDSRLQLVGASPHARVELSSPEAYAPRGIIDLSKSVCPELDAVLRRMALGESAIQQVPLRGEAKYFAYHSLKSIDWHFALVVPVEMATAASAQLVRVVENGTRRALERMLYWAGILLFFSLAAGFLLARQITAPIRELSAAAKNIASGNFSARVSVRSRDEMNTFAHAFNAMTGRIEAMILDLSRINAELSRKNTELAESEERYRLLVETMNEGLAVVDENSVLIYVNEKLCRMLDRPREEITGSPISLYFDEENLRIYQSEREKRKKREASSYEISWRRKDGQNLPTIISPVPIFDAQENFRGSFGVITDIRRIKQAEEQLRRSEERFRSLSENSPDIIFTLAPDSTFTYLNPAFEILLGYERESAMGKELAEFVKSGESSLQTIRSIALRKKTVRDLGLTMIHRDGSLRIFHLSAAPNVSSAGEVTGIVGICKDMTEYRRLENQLHQALKMEAIGTLAGGIAHDFNNLLTGILGNISLMLLDTEESHPHREKLKHMEEYVQSGAGLTRQLLGFARGGKYEIKTTDINELIRKSAEMFGRTRKQIQIHFQLKKSIAAVEVDRGQMEQVLINLFVNAWQAMPEGGDLFLSTENVILEENYVAAWQIPPGPYVKISVTDTGVGMEKAVMQRVFEPFFTTRKMGRGTGLGLASVYGIVKNHGGIIHVYSEKGKGSTFTVYLPASEKAVVREIHPDTGISRGTETLLLVDDEEMIVEVGTHLLRELGYTVISARSGQEAVNIYRMEHEKIHMVILDMIMPEMGGGKVFEHLREIRSDVKVLLSSGYSINGKAAEIMAKGCRGFIQKPFTLKQLADKVREVLDSEKSET
ncbi:MAG: PAS domain S-box protein [Desulfobacterales bacterium]